MSKVRVSAFYCEDFRIEETQQPIFIGVMSPSLRVHEYPIEISTLLLVTMFHIDNSLDEVEAHLHVDITNNHEKNKNDFPISVKKTFNKGDDHLDGDWMVISHLDLSGITISSNMSIVSTLECLDYKESIFLNINS